VSALGDAGGGKFQVKEYCLMVYYNNNILYKSSRIPKRIIPSLLWRNGGVYIGMGSVDIRSF
jgi:hypothetical protein